MRIEGVRVCSSMHDKSSMRLVGRSTIVYSGIARLSVFIIIALLLLVIDGIVLY